MTQRDFPAFCTFDSGVQRRPMYINMIDSYPSKGGQGVLGEPRIVAANS